MDFVRSILQHPRTKRIEPAETEAKRAERAGRIKTTKHKHMGRLKSLNPGEAALAPGAPKIRHENPLKPDMQTQLNYEDGTFEEKEGDWKNKQVKHKQGRLLREVKIEFGNLNPRHGGITLRDGDFDMHRYTDGRMNAVGRRMVNEENQVPNHKQEGHFDDRDHREESVKLCSSKIGMESCRFEPP